LAGGGPGRGAVRYSMTAVPACFPRPQSQAPGMFEVDEETAAAIRRAWEEGGELAGGVELRRHFPLTRDGACGPLWGG
jgi:hypothetical protein